MPSFSISNQDPREIEKAKKKALSKSNKIKKPKTKKSSPRSTVTLSDISGIPDNIGSNEYKSMWKDPDIILHCNGITLDGIHLLSGFNEREAEWGILYFGTYEIPDTRKDGFLLGDVGERYKLFQFKPKINLDNIGELQQVWRFSAHEEWDFESDNERIILREISRTICNVLGKRIQENKHNDYMDYVKNIPKIIEDEVEVLEVEKPENRNSFSDGKPVNIDLDW